jgi:hypothetical protein
MAQRVFWVDDHPIKAVLVGPPLAGAGVIALAAQGGYFWLAVKVTRKAILVRPNVQAVYDSLFAQS